VTEQDPGQPGAQQDGEIRRPEGVVKLIISITVLVALFLGAAYGAQHLAVCDNYYVIKLIYPFCFGALGVILGGSIVVDGALPLLGEKSRMRAAGGVAGAIVGFAIAQFAQPQECAPRHSLILKGFPTSGSLTIAQDGINKKREYIGLYDTTSTSIATTVERTSEGTTRDLKFKFGAENKSKDGFRVVLRFYRSGLDGTQKFEPAWSCKIAVEIREPPSGGVKRYLLVASETSRYEVDFNPNFFQEVEEALKKGATEADVMCLKGRSKLDGEGVPIEQRVEVPFYVARLKNYFGQELWYVVETRTQLSEKSAARQPEVVNGELSVGEKGNSSAGDVVIVKSAPSSGPSKPARSVATCGPSDSQLLIDRFVRGDDLDPAQRKDLYKEWPNLHCYVWPLVKSEANGLERARAIKFTVNAMINNSLDGSNLIYWQPAGSNKRDFSRSLPLLQEPDYKLVFELLKSDDLADRTEATRFVRNLPVDRFVTLFSEQADKQNALTNSQRERLAIAASFFHYGRIVEWLDPSADDNAKVAAAVTSEFKAASRWINKASLGDSAKAYEAMLWYAKAIVERERIKSDGAAKASFKQVIESIAATSEPYPSNPLHIAQAAAVTFSDTDPTPILKEIRAADVYTSSTPLSFSTGQPAANPLLYAGPGESHKRLPARTFVSGGNSRMLLRKGDWLFVQNNELIGWIRLKLT